jgi:hypothetical protein
MLISSLLRIYSLCLPASSTFLSEQTNHQQLASSTFLSEQISTSHQPNEQAVSSYESTSAFVLYSQPIRLAGGRWLVLICSKRKVLLAGCWWLVCSERKLLLVGG